MIDPVDKHQNLEVAELDDAPTWPPYNLEADYDEPAPGLTAAQRTGIEQRLRVLYGDERAPEIAEEINRLVRVHNAHKPPAIQQLEADFDAASRFDETEIVLITYGDLIVSASQPPLRTLASIVDIMFKGLVSTVHILPFFPYSSDRGFSVVDYLEVDPQIGTWEDIGKLKQSFKLMFDGVFNHVSAQSRWFQDFLDGVPGEQESFIVFSRKTAVDEDHLSLILRPRTSDLLTEYSTVNGPRFVWTTFSSDQIDLNFKNPDVLLRVASILLYYARMGADVVRLDAITYLWYELGTSCAHLDETHEVVKLMRDILDAAAPNVALISETNVPHADNITYFGNGNDEAQMVYNFALPPLVLHTFQTGDASALSGWAESLEPPSETTAFFNFLDSHDGIGLMGARGTLTEEEIARVCQRVQDHGGLVSMRNNGDGSQSPYELNITWYSALNREDAGESQELQVRRFVASRAVALVLKGVPAIYLPSFFGGRNDIEAVAGSGSNRSINRATIHEETLFEFLGDPSSSAAATAREFIHLLEKRTADSAFHPNGGQQISRLDPRVFAVRRTSVDGSSVIFSVINVSSERVEIDVSAEESGCSGHLVDLVSGDTITLAKHPVAKLKLKPYQVTWLKCVD